MANRHFRQFMFGLEPMPVKLQAVITLTGSNGAQTVTRGKGIVSATLAATGLLTIVLSDKYVTLLGVDVATQPVTYSATTSVDHAYVFQTGTDVTAASPAVKIGLVNAAGAAVTGAASDKLMVELTLNNSTAL